MPSCTYEGCDRRLHALGFCSTHYQRYKRNGQPELAPRYADGCLAADCGQPVNSYGLCVAHYQRLRKHGRLELPSVVERLVAGYEVNENGCWLWTGQPDAAGYGRVSIANEVQYAHRVSWQTFIGPIPEGLTIDHLCRVRLCVNPAHLEPVTLAENVRREMAARNVR